MSQYLILIYDDPNQYDVMSDERNTEIMTGHMAFGEKYGPKIASGNALKPTSTATTVRADGAGGFTITDGPFAETKEALGGYYLMEAADLDEAIAMAKEIPTLRGCVEVRPIMVFDN